MIRLLPAKRFSPIGVDIGTKSVKLVQLTADRSRSVSHVRWELPESAELAEPDGDAIVTAVRQARKIQQFHGHEAVLCLSHRQMFSQSVRVPKADAAILDRLVTQAVAERLPFGIEEAEIRYLEAADVRQSDTVMREVIVMACQRSLLEQTLSIVERAGLRPVAVDVEPAALARSYARQFRRDGDRTQRTMLVHVGYSRTLVMIAENEDILFVKYLDAGGRRMDKAVSQHLNMTLPKATALRRHNGDRRADQQDPEVARSVAEAIRPVIQRLCGELSKCVRYHSVTFRGKPLARLLLGGGEATPQLLESIAGRMEMKCELTDAFRDLSPVGQIGRRGQWDMAIGLALKNAGK